MDCSILPLRSFALFSLVGVLASQAPRTGAGAPAHASGVGVEDSNSGSNNLDADLTPSENWYRFFCGPGWDPTTTAPCGIHGNGATYHGCRNSADSAGARLTVQSGDAALDDVVLIAYGERPYALSIVLQGPQRSAGGLVFGDGVRCVIGTLERLYLRTAPGGILVAPEGSEPSIRTRSAGLGDTIPSPGTRYYQVWYRDGPGHFNITSALQIDWP